MGFAGSDREGERPRPGWSLDSCGRRTGGGEAGGPGGRTGSRGRAWALEARGEPRSGTGRRDAAAAAGASLPPPPGRWRGSDPQRHLGRCTHLRRPGPLPPHSSFPCTSPFLITLAAGPPPAPIPGILVRSHFTTPDLLSVTPHHHQHPFPLPHVATLHRFSVTPNYLSPTSLSGPHVTTAPPFRSPPCCFDGFVWSLFSGFVWSSPVFSFGPVPHLNHRTL